MSPRFNPTQLELFQIASAWSIEDLKRFVEIWENDTFQTVPITPNLYCVAGDMVDVIRQILSDRESVRKGGDSE